MADPDKIVETQSDTQATFDPTVGETGGESRAMDDSLLSESQDFHLVDCEETQKETQENTTMEEAGKAKQICPEASESNSLQAEMPNDVKPSEESIDEKKENEMVDKQKDKVEDSETNETKDNAKDIDEEKEKGTEDAKVGKDEDSSKEAAEEEEEDDFVQSSQLDYLSPLKKQLSNLTSVVAQKRKADEGEETLTKFPRTCSQEDALTNVRKKLDNEMDEIFKEEKLKAKAEDEIISNIIIAETQESADKTESLQQVEQELEETLSQHPLEEEEKKNGNTENHAESRKVEETKAVDSVDDKQNTSEKEENLGEANKDIEKLTTTVQGESEAMEVSVDSTVKDVVEEMTEEASRNSERSMKVDDKAENSKNDDAESSSILKNEKNDANASDEDSKKLQSNFVAPTSTTRSRMSIEVIYDRATAPPVKKTPRELVEIDEDGEKIVLDSSQESCDKSLENNKITDTSFKTCASTDYKSIDGGKDSSATDLKSVCSLTNGSKESGNADSDVTTSIQSDVITTDTSSDKKPSQMPSPDKKKRIGSSKISENPEVLIISDSEESFAEERLKSKESTSASLNHDNIKIKTIPIEKELSIVVKLKCLVYVDETTKEQVEKIITGIHCESTNGDFSTSRHRNSDNSANLADISGNDKDTSPGSVTSIPHPYPLNPRLSIASTSSTSSAGSLYAKMAGIKFQLPRGPAKHAKKIVIGESINTEKRLENEELEQIRKEWKNVDTLTCTIMNFASQELNNIDQHNGSALKADNSLERIRSSTPEVHEKEMKIAQSVTPKRTTKRSRGAAVVSSSGKATRSKNLRSSDSNGLAKDSPVPRNEKSTPRTGKKRKSSPDTSTPSIRAAMSKEKKTNEGLNTDELEVFGNQGRKQVFAKWSDNKYYPGTITGRIKTKYKVHFYDGQNKLMIEDFIVPMPMRLKPGLSVYATSNKDDYGSCGIIVEVKNKDLKTFYVVETDDGERIEVRIDNIFLTNDQVQVLKDENNIEMKSPPSTPKHLGKITLDNVIDGKRRSKRNLTPLTTTPKGKRGRASTSDNTDDLSKPSASGVSSSVKFDDKYGSTSDSNFSEIDDCATDLVGVQEEIIGTPYELNSKGQHGSVKGKGRGRKKSETPEIIANLGPIPEANSQLFKGMSFILSCVSPDTIARYTMRESFKDSEDSNSDPGTEVEEGWTSKPFVRDRLIAQLTAGGGKVYDNFESIPKEDYKNTKHITNLPNTTRTGLLCLSAEIKPYNHQWVIRCCQENRIINPAHEELPAGWSVLKNSYIEMYERILARPLRALPYVIVIPVTPINKEFVSLWKRVCENGGACVMLIKKPGDAFIEANAMLTDKNCPRWILEKAATWDIMVGSPLWIIEILIRGAVLGPETHPSFKYNYVPKSPSHISQLKKR